MSSTNDHLERFLKRTRQSDYNLEELMLISDDPARIAPLLNVPALTLPCADPLTGLPCFRAIVGLAEREYRLMLVSSTPLTLILFDVDNMKKINHRFLHPGGDSVLKQLAELLADTVLPEAFIGRFGGDSFLIVAPNTNSDQAVDLANRIDHAVRDGAFTYRGDKIRMSIGLGIAVETDGTTYRLAQNDFPEGGVSDDLQPMILAATAKMDEAKRRPRSA